MTQNEHDNCIRGIMRIRTLSDSLKASKKHSEFKSPRPEEIPACKRNLHSESCQRTVTFKHITIREYGVVIGDNPACSCGAPLSLDWEYTEQLKDAPIEAFENSRYGARRHRDELIIPAQMRTSILVQEWDCNIGAVFRACREAEVVRNGRKETADNIRRRRRYAHRTSDRI